MNRLLDSFWRAAAYCLHPRVIALSFLPLILLLALSMTLGYFFWDRAVDATRAWLDASDLMSTLLGWLTSAGAARLKGVVAPLLVVFAATPVLVMVSLLVVALLMTPALTRMVAARRFPELARKQGAGPWTGLAWALGSTALALVALIASLPLWLIPPLALVLPPLIWGWLAYRVMAYDALAEHASSEERRAIFRRHRLSLLGMGVLTGYLGAAPSLVWASGALFAAAFIVLVPVAIWIYALIFAFSSLWYAHFTLAALEELRNETLMHQSEANQIP